MAATGLGAAGLAVSGSEGRGLTDGRGLAAAELEDRRGLAAAELAERRGLAAAELAERRGLAVAGLAGGRRSTSRFFRACISNCQNQKEKLIRCKYVHYEQGISVKETVSLKRSLKELLNVKTEDC
jgi:hypothetical protein